LVGVKSRPKDVQPAGKARRIKTELILLTYIVQLTHPPLGDTKMDDPVGLFGAINGAIDGTINHAFQFLNYKNERDAWNFNKGMAEDQWAWQQRMSDLMMEREDNAIQRRVKDLEAAGLHPALAAGNAAAASGPQSPVAHELSPPKMQKFELFSQILQAQQAQANIDHTKADTARILKERDWYDATAGVGNNLKAAQIAKLDEEIEQLRWMRENVLPDQRSETQARARYYMKQLEELAHNLELSKAAKIRTTDHNELIQIFSAGLAWLQSLFAGKEPGPAPAIPKINVFENPKFKDLNWHAGSLR